MSVIKLAVNVPVSAFVKLPIAQIVREERPQVGATGRASSSKSPRTRSSTISRSRTRSPTSCASSDCTPGARRFRRRLFLARAAAPASVQRAQDRPRLCDQLPSPTRSTQACARSIDRSSAQRLRPQDRGRRHRDLTTRATSCRASACDIGQGYPVRQADAEGPAHRQDLVLHRQAAGRAAAPWWQFGAAAPACSAGRPA